MISVLSWNDTNSVTDIKKLTFRSMRIIKRVFIFLKYKKYLVFFNKPESNTLGHLISFSRQKQVKMDM